MALQLPVGMEIKADLKTGGDPSGYEKVLTPEALALVAKLSRNS